jgi:hypothetical protein
MYTFKTIAMATIITLVIFTVCGCIYLSGGFPLGPILYYPAYAVIYPGIRVASFIPARYVSPVESDVIALVLNFIEILIIALWVLEVRRRRAEAFNAEGNSQDEHAVARFARYTVIVFVGLVAGALGYDVAFFLCRSSDFLVIIGGLSSGAALAGLILWMFGRRQSAIGYIVGTVSLFSGWFVSIIYVSLVYHHRASEILSESPEWLALICAALASALIFRQSKMSMPDPYIGEDKEETSL